MASRPPVDLFNERDDAYYQSLCPPHQEYPPPMAEVPSPRLSPQTPDFQVPMSRWEQLPGPAYVPYAEHYDRRQDHQKSIHRDLPEHEGAYSRPRHDSGHDVNIEEVRIHRRVYNNNATKARSSTSSSTDQSCGSKRRSHGTAIPLSEDDHISRPRMNRRSPPREVGQRRGISSEFRSRRGRSHGGQLQRQPVERPGRKSGYLQNFRARVQEKGGVDGIITPLRLGILLGAFDIIGGSLCLWMAHRKFGKGGQKNVSPDVDSGRHARDVRGSRRLRSRGTVRDEPEYRPTCESETDSEDEERQRRAAAFVREQARLDVDRNRHMGGGEKGL